ncbi:MAG: M23 family metallopeptidase [Gemmatimonadales bacterium]|jgi:murein DD-endopeptidase MepM/ murein hydrolase activator NlpD
MGAKETIPLMLEVRYPGGDVDEPFLRLPVGVTEFAVERLRVASRFTQPPDSALRVRIAAERERSRAVVRAAHDGARLWSGGFIMPVEGRVTSPFGKGREFNGRVQSRHYGTDLDGDRGTPVRAPNRGVVALTDDTYYGGRVVYLAHGDGLITGYMHLSEISVAQGDTVEQGRVLGKVGATGRVTGPHLHWLARYGSVLVDPMSLFDIEAEAFDRRRR